MRSVIEAKTKKYKFKAKVWKYDGASAWRFVTLPKSLARTIRSKHGSQEEGWGRLKTEASIDSPAKCAWQTSIWFDTKAGSYLLPVKSSVRKLARIDDGASITVTIRVEIEDARFKSWNRRF